MRRSVNGSGVAGRVLIGLSLSAVLGLAGCGGGSGDATPSARPSAGVTRTQPAASPTPERTRADAAQPQRTQEPAPTQAETPARPQAETPAGTPAAPPTAAETPAAPPTAAVVPPAQPTAGRPTTGEPATPPAPTTAAGAVPPPVATTPPATATASTPAASGGTGGLSTLGWLLVLVLVGGAVVAALLVRRSHQASTWDEAAATLDAETRTAAARLPSVLVTDTPVQRGLAWPPVRAGLAELAGRWAGLAQRATDEPRRSRSLSARALIEDLVAAVDAENEALGSGRDWMLLRPRVNDAERALAAALAMPASPPPGQADEPAPPPAGRDRPPAGGQPVTPPTVS